MPPTVTATVLYRPEDRRLRFLPEGPYPLGDSSMSWVAIQHGADANVGSLNLLNIATGDNCSHVLPGRPGFAFPCDDEHSFVVGCERTLGIFHTADKTWSPFYEHIEDQVQGTVINDGLVWGDNLIFGTKDLEFKTKKAGLYLWRGSDQRLIQFRNDQICSNGKAIIQVDGEMFLLDIDSPTRTIVRYPLDIVGGTLGEAQTVVDLTDNPAVPDGAIVTPDRKSVIVSLYNPNPADHGETHQYSLAKGELEAIWQTPDSPQNTCPNLVLHSGKVHLVITTAVEHMPEERQQVSREAGSLFIAPTDFKSIGDAAKFPLAALSAT